MAMPTLSALKAVFYLPNAGSKIAIGLAAFAVYFPVALWLKYSYVPPAAPPGSVLELKRPFGRFTAAESFAYYAATPSLNDKADTLYLTVSPYVVYENDQKLGPAHIIHTDIAKLGQGRFSHWKDLGFVISSSDGTSPASNGRRYWVVLPP
jgi:hypothetical protein